MVVKNLSLSRSFSRHFDVIMIFFRLHLDIRGNRLGVNIELAYLLVARSTFASRNNVLAMREHAPSFVYHRS